MLLFVFLYHSSNILLDENFTPKLGHSGLRLYSADKKSECAVMKTKVLQASLTYLPEDFVRHGQLTARVDVFSCGVVRCLSSMCCCSPWCLCTGNWM